MDDDFKSPVTAHLEELRSRIIYSLVFLVIATGVALYITDKYVFQWIMLPIKGLPDVEIQVLGPADIFGAYFKTSFIIGLILAIPFIMHQAWLFLKPGLKLNEQRFLLLLTPTAAILFLIGTSFIYLVLLPASLKFLLGFDIGIEVQVDLTLDRYISFVLLLLLAGGAIFQIPLVAFFLAKTGLVSPEMLSGKRKIAILFSVILGAMLTPTGDPINLMLLSIPIYLLFEVSIIVARLAYPRKKIKQQKGLDED